MFHGLWDDDELTMAKEFKIEITFDAETKDCKVTGPIHEPDLCYLGLELGRRVIEQYSRKKIMVGPAAPAKLAPVRIKLPPLKALFGGR
jgi:hypothetical protein